MFKYSTILMVLIGAVGLPYLFSTGSTIHQKVYNAFDNNDTTVEPTSDAHLSTPVTSQDRPTIKQLDAATKPAPSLGQVEVQPLANVFRFDLTTAWVLGTWSRVSTSSAELDLQAYRVALVTGTHEGDLAGALTYYFNPQQRVQRITFQGSTGDARPLVHHLATQHHFVRQVAPDPGLFLYQVVDRGKVISELRIKPVSIVRKDDAHARFELTLVMERPSSLK